MIESSEPEAPRGCSAGRRTPLNADPLGNRRLKLDSLPHETLLATLGEVAVAFVGFSIVAAILRSESIRRFHAMRDVAQIGLQAVAASFLPLAIHAYGASPDVTWRVGSAAFLVLSGLGIGQAVRSRLQHSDSYEFQNEPIRNAVLVTLNVGGAGLLLFNILLGGPGSGARYATAVLLMLVIAGLQFLAAAFSAPPDPPAA